MNLNDILSNASDLVGCDGITAGIQSLYLVKCGDGSDLYNVGESISQFVEVNQNNIIWINFDFNTCNFRSRLKISDAGEYYENQISFKLSRSLGSSLKNFREEKFWVIMKKGEQWLVSGDDYCPYYLSFDFTSGKAPGEDNGFECELSGQQLRPYHLYSA
jgi:hypothetical protein